MAFTSNTYTAALDIKRRTPHRPLIIEGDAGVVLDLSLTDNGAAMDITGLYARCVFRRSDGRTVLVSESDDPCPMTVTKATGKIVITVPRTCFRDGDNFLQVQILDGDPDSGTCLSSTFPLLLRAYNCLLTNEAVEESVEFPILEWLIDALRNMDVSITMVSPTTAADASLTLSDGAYHLALTIPKGAKIVDIDVVEGLQSYSMVFTLDDGSIVSCAIPNWVTAEWVAAQNFVDSDGLASALLTYATKQYVANAIANSGHYTKPSGGIPSTDMTSAVQASLALADSAYQKPGGGIPSTDMDALVQLALARANNPAGMTGATASADGTAGVVPAPEAGDQGKYLKGNGTWAAIPVFTGAGDSRGAAGLVPPPEIADVDKFLKGDGTWASAGGGGGGGTTDDIEVVLPSGTPDTDPLEGGETATVAMGKINAIITALADKLDEDGAGDAVTATRVNSASTFVDIPSNQPITLADLLATLGRWYVEIGRKQDELTAGTGISISNSTISAPAMTGATSSAAGSAGIVPAPASSEYQKYLRGDGAWATPSGGSEKVIFISTSDGFDDVKRAYDAGMTCILRTSTVDYVMTYYKYMEGDTSQAWFASEVDGEIKQYHLVNSNNTDTWTASTVDIPQPLVATYTITIDSQTGSISSVSCDKTYAEVAAAIQAKIPVEAYVVMGGVVIGKCSSVSLIMGSICFAVVDATDTNEVRVIWLLHGNGLIEADVYFIPPISDNTPVMNGTASAGQRTDCSRADHVHPSDTTKADKVATVTVSSAGAVSQALDAGKYYKFTGALTSLTITLNATTDLPIYHFRFTEPSTAFDPTLPSGTKLPANHTWEADTIYEVSILDGIAAVKGWAVS